MEDQAVDAAFEDELAIELRLARDVVLLVAAGGAPRVTLANLRHGGLIAEPLREFADEVGVGVTTVPAADPQRIDLVAAIRPALRLVTA